MTQRPQERESSNQPSNTDRPAAGSISTAPAGKARSKRRRARRRAPHEPARMEMTPMIDVTFLLLVFFLCTLRFKPLEGKLNAYLPKDTGQAYAASEPEPELRVRVAVVTPGAKLWAGDPDRATPFDPRDPRHRRFAPGSDRRLEWRVGARIAGRFAEFAEDLESQAQQHDGRPVVLDVAAGVHTGEAVRVLDALQSAGFREVRFAPARDR